MCLHFFAFSKHNFLSLSREMTYISSLANKREKRGAWRKLESKNRKNVILLLTGDDAAADIVRFRNPFDAVNKQSLQKDRTLRLFTITKHSWWPTEQLTITTHCNSWKIPCSSRSTYCKHAFASEFLLYWERNLGSAKRFYSDAKILKF